MGKKMSVSMATADWQFVIGHLLIGSDIEQTVGHADSAARTRALADYIAQQLTEPS